MRNPLRSGPKPCPSATAGSARWVFGGVTSERLQLNEATLWSGAPRDWNNPGARAALPQVRAAALAGDYAKATELSKQMQGLYSEAYMPLADLKLSFWGFEDATGYERTLDLARAVSTTCASRAEAAPPTRARCSAASPTRSSSSGSAATSRARSTSRSVP